MLTSNAPINLVDIPVNEAKVFLVNITNNDGAAAIIDEIFVGCQSCTTVSMPKRTIYVNETVPMEVTFLPRTLGVHNKTVTLSYRQNEVQLRLTVNFTANVIK